MYYRSAETIKNVLFVFICVVGVGVSAFFLNAWRAATSACLQIWLEVSSSSFQSSTVYSQMMQFCRKQATEDNLQGPFCTLQVRRCFYRYSAYDLPILPILFSF